MKKIDLFVTILLIVSGIILTLSIMGNQVTERTKQYIDKNISFSHVEVELDENGNESFNKVDSFEVFKAYYDENGKVTVASSSGTDKIIAPGTSNEVTFKVDNTTKRVFYYTVNMNAYFSNSEVELPIKVSLKRYDGTYVYGSSDENELIGNFKNVKDEYALKPDRYSYYTFEWEWPFESGDDALDTLLGNMSNEEPLTLTVELEFEGLFNATMTPKGIKKDDVNTTTILIVALVAAPGVLIGCTSYYIILKRKLNASK